MPTIRSTLSSEAQKLLEAADQVIRLTAHHTTCGCSCGATDKFKEARSEFYRLWRRLKEDPNGSNIKVHPSR